MNKNLAKKIDLIIFSKSQMFQAFLPILSQSSGLLMLGFLLLQAGASPTPSASAANGANTPQFLIGLNVFRLTAAYSLPLLNPLVTMVGICLYMIDRLFCYFNFLQQKLVRKLFFNFRRYYDKLTKYQMNKFKFAHTKQP